MAYLVKAPRVGRSQGAVIFWGLVSAVFASAFCYYYLENRNNEDRNRALFEQVKVLQDESDTLHAERLKMEAAAGETEKQLQEREDFLQQKETNLAEQESQLESAGSQNQSQSLLGQQQAATVKRFDDTVRQIVARTPQADVIVRGGRPVLRLPAPVFFPPAATQLSAEGKADLDQVAQAVSLPPGRFELRVETFTDNLAEGTDGSGDPWTLTAARAAAIARYLHDRKALPAQDVLAIGRANSDTGSGEANLERRVEITLAPVAPVFHTPTPKAARRVVALPVAKPVNAEPDSAGGAATGVP